ncbi:collagenase-like protease [Salmonella enterica subsp. enterica serovar Typhimurium]|nr:collagenase-like protease [Salmonella enterica subsp. enterica serovar Typhimurium]
MRQQPHYLELLSPARDAAIAREAILHGADAVYIGGPGFGARHNASNSLRDIADLVPFAHRYGARIFVTLNTILHDDELEPAQRLITDLYNTGVDALIVQDMGILELDIPPIELHASTQCDIRSVEKAKFLADVGFSQIVLARELNLSQIAAIHQATDATIEFFIHGALCVAYSGQCYISHAQTGRSANRGDCSQACRLPYTLKDDQGRVVSYEKHLLSMKDNDQTANLGALIDAGVRSFKIEGRYKDMSYVKNITAHYRQMLDAIIEQRGDLARASFRANTVEKTGHNRYRVWPNDMPADLHKVRPHHPLNRNLDHNWQQALTKTSSERRVAVDIMLGGWQEQLILTLTSEDGVCITHTLDGVFEEANNSEKALNNLKAGLAKLGQTPYYARDMQVTLPAALFVPNSLLNQFRREAIDMLDAARLAHYQRGRRKPVAQPAPVYPQTHLSFLANVYNHKAREFYHRYGVQLIDAAYEAHQEKGEVPVMITKHCLRFAFNLCPKQAKGNIKSWKATPMQLVHGDEVLTLKFDCRPCEMHVIGKIKNHILKMPQPGSVVASVSPEALMKTLPKRRGV